MISVKVDNLSISNVGFVLLLKGDGDERTLPIFVGVPEAQAIALHLNKVNTPRPMSHDLMKNMLDVMEGRLDRVEVWDLSNGTFFGKLVVVFEGQTLEIDSRPSDAVALALRCKAPIFVADKVMEEAGVVLESDVLDNEDDDEARPTEAEIHKDPVDALRSELLRAIKEERYEDAAGLRDKIKKSSTSN